MLRYARNDGGEKSQQFFMADEMKHHAGGALNPVIARRLKADAANQKPRVRPLVCFATLAMTARRGLF